METQVTDVDVPVRNGRRDELTIMTDILGYLLEPRRITHILYSSNLSYFALRKHLLSLMKLGLIEEVDGPYRKFRVTENGRKFLELIT